MFDFDPNRCDRCGSRFDEIGLGGCFCPPEHEDTPVSTTNDNAVLSPAEYLRRREERVTRERREREEADRRQREALDDEALVRHASDFLAAIKNGDDPWGNEPTHSVAHGIAPEAAQAVRRGLTAKGWNVEVTVGSTFVGPGGRGEMQATHYDKTVCDVLVHRPR